MAFFSDRRQAPDRISPDFFLSIKKGIHKTRLPIMIIYWIIITNGISGSIILIMAVTAMMPVRIIKLT